MPVQRTRSTFWVKMGIIFAADIFKCILLIACGEDCSLQSNWQCVIYGLGNDLMLKGQSTTHYNDIIMSAVASQITSVSIVCSTLGSGPDQRIHQRSASLAFVRGIHRWAVNSPHKGSVTRKMFPFNDVIMLEMLTNMSVIIWHHYTRLN